MLRGEQQYAFEQREASEGGGAKAAVVRDEFIPYPDVHRFPEVTRPSRIQLVLKRLLDISVAAAALFFLAPLMLILGIMVWSHDGGPVFYRQTRIGWRGRTFGCLKFRTMVVNSDERLAALLRSDPVAAAEWARDHKLKNDPRITPLGRFLRKTSLDELPQLFNILRGEMSLVGPRPIVQAEVAKYGEAFIDYASVRPGLTGLWQVSGRNDASYEERVRLDSQYVRSWSLADDLKIVLLTFPALLGKGAY